MPTENSTSHVVCSTEPPSLKPLIDQTIDQRLMEEAAKYGYTNINGPSLIKVPSWANNSLGKYYLYFAHHKGPYIRMAYADTLRGPWTMYDGEVLSLANAIMSTEEKPPAWWKSLRKYTSWTEARAIVQTLLKNGDKLYIFYSRVGQSPERVLCTAMDISSSNWNDWEVGEPSEVARPQLQMEGAQEPNLPSMRGEAGVIVNQLRDPCVFRDEGDLYLLYTGGGEQNIGMRKLFINDIL